MAYPRRLPKRKYWYHGTTIENAVKILDEGGLKNRVFGIYFANTAQYAGGFARQRSQHTQSNEIVVFKIPTKRLKNLELGTDHDPSFYPKDLVTAMTNELLVPVFREDICAHYIYD